ncbi:MAG: hypothetical protein HOV94_14580 [Saccharothrix sp.]|nr:hypothetical protein [Saccharothrix sp.]
MRDGMPLVAHDLHFVRDAGGLAPEWEQFTSLVHDDGLVEVDHPLLPLAPVLTGLDPVAERTLADRLTAVLDAVERLAERYPVDEDLQRLLGLPPALHDWAVRDDHPGRHVDYCRFDLGGDSTDTAQVFEIGGDFPMSNMCGLLNGYWRRVAAAGAFTGHYRPARFEEPAWMVDELLDIAARRGVDPDAQRRVAVLCADSFRSAGEIRLIEGQIRRRGRAPVTTSPEEFDEDDVRLGFLPFLSRPLVDEPARYRRLFQRIADGDLVVFNGVRGRLVGGNKLTLAALSDPRFRPVFTDAQAAAIDAVIPWSRKVGDGAGVADVVADRADLVLKAPFDALSTSVFIGREHDRDRWRRLVDEGARHGWLVQRFVRSQYVPTDAGALRRTLGVMFCGGQVAGYNGRVTTSLVDEFTSGGLHAVFGNHSAARVNAGAARAAQ